MGKMVLLSDAMAVNISQMKMELLTTDTGTCPMYTGTPQLNSPEINSDR